MKLITPDIRPEVRASDHAASLLLDLSSHLGTRTPPPRGDTVDVLAA
jgi:hypothetical protein